MKTHYKIAWHKADGTLKTCSDDLVAWGDGIWKDEYRGTTHPTPEHWFESINHEFFEKGDAPPKLFVASRTAWREVGELPEIGQFWQSNETNTIYIVRAITGPYVSLGIPESPISKSMVTSYMIKTHTRL